MVLVKFIIMKSSVIGIWYSWTLIVKCCAPHTPLDRDGGLSCPTYPLYPDGGLLCPTYPWILMVDCCAPHTPWILMVDYHSPRSPWNLLGAVMPTYPLEWILLCACHFHIPTALCHNLHSTWTMLGDSYSVYIP